MYKCSSENSGMKNEHTVKFYPAVAELSGDVMVYQGTHHLQNKYIQ